ncbi:hypothetical protein [Streptomyces glaucescens]|uniref:Uncharacterized protein n=1 Tax=Streptomyces glaucescens TaxID=1907 RepID=A0A089XAE0_STRGA|nr:hypothetical protein [Streptomyces glaucescens]AIR98119.1 hypothetical protein SGLAU_10570 [Streptomyces glaucescens]
MSANRETEHDMSHTDIAFLLAEAADEVEIGIAPYQSVLRGGRRRRARRWAVAAATALVISGSSATLAVAGLPDGGGDRVAPPAARSQSATADVFAPQRTVLARGTDGGKEWSVVLDVWAAPRDETEAQAQLTRMAESGQFPEEVRNAYVLVGSSHYFVHSVVDGTASLVMWSAFPPDQNPPSDLTTAAVPLDPDGDGPDRLVVGQVTRAAGEVTCTWKDGTGTVVGRAPEGTGTPADTGFIRHAEGSPVDWFVCLAPRGTEYASAEVTKLAERPGR